VIYLLRHGDAEDGNGDDAARRLTGANVALKKGGIAVVDGSELITLLRPAQLFLIAGIPA
jgi:hypothetical protein